MNKRYLGHLADHDPLHYYLQYDILPQISGPAQHADFRVFQLTGSNDVYLYEDRYSGSKVVGKFFLSARKREPVRAAKLMAREFDNLVLLRNHGLNAMPHYVVRPLGRNQWLNCIVVVEYCQGETLSAIIQDALFRGGESRLYRKLTALAYFLATLHNRTVMDTRINFQEDCAYLDRLTGMLHNMLLIDHDQTTELAWLRDQWRSQERMWQDRQVHVHGDATPDNFLFGNGLEVITFDLERSKPADRVFDVGRIAGELKHFFLQKTGNRHSAEPFIGHFLWEYSCHFPDRLQTFKAITGRIPFHISLTLLRIARNSWIEPTHRRRLINEAIINLRRFT